MKPVELRTRTADELDELLASLRRERFNLRFQRASGQLEQTSRMRQVRREIARILTIRQERRRQTAQ